MSTYKPTRIPEPGPWGVVEARPAGSDADERHMFVRFPDGYWEGEWYGGMDWDELLDPVLVREGLS
jgi:hypothetical protein